MSEDRGQKTEDRRQRTEDSGQMTEDRCQMTEVIECGIRNAECGMVRLSPRNVQPVASDE